MCKLPEGLPTFALPNVPLNWETLQIILPYSLTMAAVGLLESLLTAQIVDDMTDTDSDKQRECAGQGGARSEEHTSELQSLMRISYAVFGLKKKKTQTSRTKHIQ